MLRSTVLAAVVALAIPAVAGADMTIGSAAIPDGASPTPCSDDMYGNNTQVVTMADSDPSTPFAVPSGAWEVTAWQINATGAEPGATVTFVVLHPQTTATVGEESVVFESVVGTDTETLPSTPPAGGIVNFPISTPVAVQAGDTIGSYAAPSTPSAECGYTGGTLPRDDVSALAVGRGLTGAPTTGTGLESFPEAFARINLAATLTQASYDAGVSFGAAPANGVVGQPLPLTATVTNHGPPTGSITFVDPVPSGLPVTYAGSDDGNCTTQASVNVVTCTFANMPAGQSAEVVILVKPRAAASYADPATVSVLTGATDPTASNNHATLSLKVTAAAGAGPTECVVPKLGGASVALVTNVLPMLGCKLGTVRKLHSTRVPKGEVIGTSPGAGSYALDEVIALKVSSGPARKKHKRHAHLGKR